MVVETDAIEAGADGGIRAIVRDLPKLHPIGPSSQQVDLQQP